MKHFAKILALLLSVVMIIGMLPTVAFAQEPETEPEIVEVVTPEHEAELQADVLGGIGDYLDGLNKRGSSIEKEDFYEATESIKEIVLRSATYVKGSLVEHGSGFYWQTTTGITCGYFPEHEYKMAVMRANNASSETKNATASACTNYNNSQAGSSDVCLVGPMYAEDTSFTDQYGNEAASIAAATGGTAWKLINTNATVTNIANAISKCKVVIFDSHGNTDWGYFDGGSDGTGEADCVTQANTSYLCLSSGTGITNADMAYVSATNANSANSTFCHAYADSSGNYVIDGTAIANHMPNNAPDSMLWMAICLGMSTPGLQQPLRAKGVSVVYGYSQSVTFTGDYEYEEAFWDKMIAGETVATAFSYMTRSYKWDPGYASSYNTIGKARYNYVAFPNVVSAQDTYQGQRSTNPSSTSGTSTTYNASYGACNVQTVNSTWRLLGTPEPATVTLMAGSSQYGSTISTTTNTNATLPNYSGTVPTGYTFAGWTDAAISGTTNAKPTLYNGTYPTGSNTASTLYACFSKEESGGSGTGEWTLLESASNLSAGMTVVFASNAQGKTAGDISSQIMASVDSTFASGYGTITSLGSDTVQMTVGGSTGAWTFENGSGQLLGATAVKKLAWGSGTTTWDVSISSGAATIQSTTGSYGRFLYNTDSPRFTTYTSNTSASMLLPQIYYMDGTGSTYSYTTTISTCNHNWQVTDTVDATCTATGAIEYTCSICGDSYIEETAALGHNMVAGTVHAATCTEDGYTEYACSRCDATDIGDIVAATGHNYVNGVCSVCGAEEPETPAVTSGWYLVDDYTSLEDGTYAIISPNNYAFNGTITSGHGQKTADAFSFDANGYAASAPEGTLELTFTASGSGFTVNSENGYLYATKASSGGLAFHDSESSYWTFSAEGGIYAANSAHLRSYDDTFRTYAGNSNATIHLAAKNSSSYLTEAGAPYYAVTYYENAGAVTVTNLPSNASVREGSSYTIPNTIPVRDGYRFDGWATSAGGAVVYAASGLPATISSVSAAVNLYAKWTLRATVTFYDTDNTTIFDTVYTYAGETPTAPASNPTKADSDPHYYTFAGWSRTAGGTVESPLAVIGSSESTRAYYPVFTEHTRIEAVDDSFVLDFDRNATLDVLANDRNTDGVTLTLGTAPAGITLTKNANNTITFTVPGGQLTTASYTFTYTLSKSGETDSTATVTVKPASAIYYEDSNSFFTYTDGTKGKWSVVGNDNAWTQSAIDTDSESAVGYDESANSLTWSAGVTHKANVGNSTDYGTSGSSETWPYMEFTFVGNAFTLSMMRNNYTGLISVYVDGTKVKNVATSYGATGGAYDPDKPNGGFIYESSESNYGMPTFYWKAENGAVGTHTVKVQVLYSPTFEHNDPKVGNYDVYIDGVTIYNPIAGSTAYNYISFRDTVLATGSLGVPTTTPHNYVATLSPASLSLNTGNTGVLQLSLTDENVPVYSGYTVVYTSSNPSIATVTPAGSLNATTGVNTATVTGVSAGQATITATITTPGSTTLTRTATVIVSETGKTVNYYVNGTVWDSEQVAEGNDPSFPNVIGAYNELAGYSHDYTFLGWIPAAIAEDTTAQPATIYTSGDSYELTGATAFHAVFRYSVSGSSGSEFTLSYTNNDTTYYMGMDNGNGRIAVSTDEAEAASYGLEQIGESEYYYLYYLDASSNKVYVTGNAGSSNSRDLTFSSTAPSSGYYKWQVDENGKFWSYNASNEQGGAVAINSSDKVYARMYTSGQWGEFVQNATGTTTRYYATTLGAAGAITHSYEVSITPTSLALHVGETGSVSATLTDNGATVTGATPTYTTSMSSVATVAADGTVTAVANGNATITATFTVGGTDYTATCSVAVTTLATYNVTYMVNGSQYGQTESVVQGNSPSFTAPSYDTSSYNAHAYEFLGWKEGSALSADTTETQTLYVAGNTRVISGNTTYYAVYRYTEGGSVTTAVEDLANGGSADYVIAANVGGTYYAMSNTFATKINGTSITNPGSSISSSDATNYVVTIAKTSDGFTISNGTTLLGYSGSSTNFSTDGTTNTYWTITTSPSDGSGNGYKGGSYGIRSTQTSTRGILFNGSQFGAYGVSQSSGTYYDVEIIPVGDSSSATYYATTLNVAAAHNYVASISPTSVTIEAGQETTAIGTLTDNGITTTAYTPTYSSSNTGVATVSSIGYVDAISAGTANITVSYDVDGTTYSAVCAVTVTPATVVTSYTVSYYVNGSLFETETVAENGHPDFDAPTTDISAYDAQDYTFAGWAANTVSDTTTAPTMYTASTASSYTVTGDVTFHAVYTWSEGGSGSGSGSGNYELVSASEATAGSYVIGALRSDSATNAYYFATGTVASGDMNTTSSSVTVSGTSIAPSSLPSGTMVFTFSGDNSNGFTIATSNGDYLGYTATSNRKLAFASSYSSTKWTVADKSGSLNSKGTYLSCKTGTYTISENSTAVGAIRGYANTTVYRAIYLFKLNSSGSGSGSSGTDYYTTTLAAGDGETATLNVSPSSLSLSTGGYGQIAVTAANGGANAYVTATSSSNSVAQVYALNDGNNTFGVSAGSTGSATITIRYFDSSANQLASQTVSVTVTAASGTGGTNADYGRVGSDGNAPTTSGNVNAGTRGVVATSISQKAADYYESKGVTWADLTALAGVNSTSSVTAASGNALKSRLQSLMTLSNTVTYSSLTTYWPSTDKSGGSSQNLYIYSNVTSNSSVSREHVWPKSRGQFYESGAGSDLQHLRPEESTVNSTRGNHTMGYVNGVVSGASTKTYGGSTVLWYSGSYSSNNCDGLVEVMDVCKGDVARILLYVYTEYPENTNLFTKTSGGGSGNNASDGNKVIESRDTLLKWCALDPVDTWEMSRNDAVQNIQGNRNVYIDYPELAWMIFNLTPPSTMQTPSGQAAAGNVGTRDADTTNYGTSAVNNSAVMSAEPAPATRGGATRAIGDENTNLPVTGAVMLNGIGQISNNEDVMNYLAQYGAANCLVVPANGSVVFYLTGGSSESMISIGASALNGTGTTLKVYQISAVSGSSATGTVLLEQSLVSSTEMYYRIKGIAWTGDKSNVLMVRNEGSAPMLLTNLRSVSGTVEGHISTGGEESSSVSGQSATRGITRSAENELQMVIDSSAILAGIAGVQSINDGSFDDETPVTPVDPEPTDSDIVLRGNSISLNGQIDVNFYLDISDELFDDGVYATIDGVKVDFTEGQYGTMVSKKLPAKEMNTKVTLKLYAADGTPLTFKSGSSTVTESRYSVQDYLTYVISHPDTCGDELVKLCKAMSDYGAYTQLTLGFDVENAKDIYLADEIAAVTCEGYGYEFTPNTENISFLGASVVTESETAIRAYFSLKGEGFTATVDGEPAAIQTNERGTFVEIANISAKNLGDAHTIVVTNGDETVTISNCSAYSYVQSVLNYAGASDSLKLAVKALKLYGDLAAEYFNK